MLKVKFTRSEKRAMKKISRLRLGGATMGVKEFRQYCRDRVKNGYGHDKSFYRKLGNTFQ